MAAWAACALRAMVGAAVAPGRHPSAAAAVSAVVAAASAAWAAAAEPGAVDDKRQRPVRRFRTRLPLFPRRTGACGG